MARPGRALGAERSTLERSFARDLSHVRVHDDAAATASARALRADAFTVGHDVVLGTRTPPLALLAHEVAHTLQQAPWHGQSVATGAPDTVHERAADAAAGRVARGEPAALAPAMPIAPVVQRAEAGTYISKQGEADLPAYLDAAQHFYQGWGHPNVMRVNTMEDVVNDLDKQKGHIDTFRIVSHGTEGQMWLGTLNGLDTTRFDKDEAGMRSPADFRALDARFRIITDELFTQWVKKLLVDDTTKPLLAGMGVTAVPAFASVEGLYLRGVLERYFIDVAKGSDDKPSKIDDRGLYLQFAEHRRKAYYNALLAAAPDTARKALKKNLDSLQVEARAALERADQTVTLDDQPAPEMIDSTKKTHRLLPVIDRAIDEGAGAGPYTKKLARLRERIDETTHIELRGCHLGSSPDFLDTLRALFGKPDHLPSISAPDLYQYFFALGGMQRFGATKAEAAARDADFDKVGTTFDERMRLLAGEAMRALDESNLAEFATKYGLDKKRLTLLNPELVSDEPWKSATRPLVWLVARKRKAGPNKTFEEFAGSSFGDTSLGPTLRRYNPQIKKPTIWDIGKTELQPADDIWLCPAEMHTSTIWERVIDPSLPDQHVPLRDRTDSAAQTKADYAASLKSGQVFIFVQDGHINLRLDASNTASSLAKWLATLNYGPQSAATIEKRLGPNAANVNAIYVDFLSSNYPAIDVSDPVFGDDPRYSAHIIRRP